MGRKVAIVIFGCLVFFGAIGGFVYWVLQATGAPVKVIRAHLDAINQGDYARAYGYFSQSLRAELSPQQFQSFVEQHSAALKTSDSTFNSRSISNNVATIRGTLTGKSGAVTPVRYTLVWETERWLIQGFRLGEPPPAE